MTADPNTIDYEALAQDAMRGVVRTILTRVAEHGLPGEHHFYISFDTLAQGTILSKRLKEKYPEEMTIVLQHRFWDLIVTDVRFEVKLTFDGIPERLVVPFTAIKVFFDPSVRYGLQFESPDFGPDAISHPAGQDDTPATGAPAVAGMPRPRPLPKTRAPRKTKSEKAVPPHVPAETERPAAAKPAAEATPSQPKTTKPAPAPAPAAVTSAPQAPAGGAQVVSLDAFRKK